jgi:hypothetical protein
LQYVFGAEGWLPEAASAQVPSDANVSAATAAKKHVVCFISFFLCYVLIYFPESGFHTA